MLTYDEVLVLRSDAHQDARSILRVDLDRERVFARRSPVRRYPLLTAEARALFAELFLRRRSLAEVEAGIDAGDDALRDLARSLHAALADLELRRGGSEESVVSDRTSE
jgi:hypothetical protein